MNTILVIGAPGQGKSPFIQKYIQDRKCFVFDVQNEYGTRTKYANQKPIALSDNVNAERSRYTGYDMKEFINLASKKRDTVVVFEEATGFFRGKIGDVMSKYLLSRWHTGNDSLLVFHSINRVPPEIMEMCNYVCLFKTLDETDTVHRKYSRLSQAFLHLQDEPDGSNVFLKLL